MKKFLASIAAASLVLSLGTTAFAEAGDASVGSLSSADAPMEDGVDIDVNVQLVSNDTAVIYSVDIAWEDMTFTYNLSSKVWDPTTRDYIEAEGGGSWVDDTKTITVTNNSNNGIEVSGNFEADTTDVINASVSVSSASIPTADGTKDDETGPQGTLTATASGSLAKGGEAELSTLTEDPVLVGKITLTIEGAT